MPQKHRNPPQKRVSPSSIEDATNITEVNEAAAAYQSMPVLYPILTDSVPRPESRMTAFEKMQIVHSGISKHDLELLKQKANLDYDQLASVLAVTRATLINKKGKEKFNTAVSERILSVADIYSYGYEVFEDELSFNQWMFNPNKALGGQFPYAIMDTQFGREEVRRLIGRIDYGVYS